MEHDQAMDFEALESPDRTIQTEAFLRLQQAAEKQVDWAYALWENLREDLGHRDNHRRSIAAQLLCGLAKSDPEGRIFGVFPKLLEVTRDPRFVTARHCLQSLWKIGLAGEDRRRLLLSGLAGRYADCVEEKNSTLIRYDIVEGLRLLYDHVPDAEIKDLALQLIGQEEDLKYRKKYASVWKKA